MIEFNYIVCNVQQLLVNNLKHECIQLKFIDHLKQFPGFILIWNDNLGWTDFNPEEVSYKEMVELHELFTKKMGLPSLVVDADDLLENPGTFCEFFILYKSNVIHSKVLHVAITA